MSSIESHLSNKPKQVFFNPINIFDTFTHSITLLYIFNKLFSFNVNFLIYSELARKGESHENMEDMVMYANEELSRIRGDVSVVSVGSASAVSSPAIKMNRGLTYESKEETGSSSSAIRANKK